MSGSFEKVQKNFGFGYMRLPMKGEDVDIPQTTAMVDAFLGNGFNYFDTAHGYINGKSELAIRECLSSRYPRERYILTNKLSANYFEKEEDIRPLFQQQLEACGVEYFDFYLMHALSASRMAQYESTRAFEIALELKQEGKIHHLGISFHDSAEVLDQILTSHPEIEVVQTVGDMFASVNVGGRVAIITFHSLEDRIVKKAFASFCKGCECPPSYPICVCGKTPEGSLPFKKVLPSEREIEENQRSRSATLRCVERIREKE